MKPSLVRKSRELKSSFSMSSMDSLATTSSTAASYSALIRLLKSSIYVFSENNGLAILSLDDLTCRYSMGSFSDSIEWFQWMLDDGIFVVGTRDGMAQRWRLAGGSGVLEDLLLTTCPDFDEANPSIRWVSFANVSSHGFISFPCYAYHPSLCLLCLSPLSICLSPSPTGCIVGTL